MILISSRACPATIKQCILEVLDFGGIYLVLWIERLNVLLQGKLLCCLTGMISLELSCFDGIFGSIVLRPNILYSRLYWNQIISQRRGSLIYFLAYIFLMHFSLKLPNKG